jgi:drug/metabolite transporter (DMT)-like permease
MNNNLKGTIAILILTALYGSYGVFNRLIGQEFGTFSQHLVRNGLVIIFSLFSLVVFKQTFKKIKKKDLKWILLWLLTGSWVMIALFLAFNYLLISTVYFLFYSTMIISGVACGKIFFKEKLDYVKIISIIFSILGLTSIYSLVVNPEDLPYVLLSLGAGVALGFWNTISKKFSSNYPELQLVFWDASFSTLVGLIGLILTSEALPAVGLTSGWLWITVYAIVQIFTVGLLVFGFKHLEAQVGSVMMPIEIVFASLFSYLIFGESLSTGSIIGGALIAAAAFLPNIKMVLKKDKA